MAITAKSVLSLLSGWRSAKDAGFSDRDAFHLSSALARGSRIDATIDDMRSAGLFDDRDAFVAREALLRAESERIIARLVHPGCWFCQRGTAPGHSHIGGAE